ncbi:uncharacterized protein LOC133300793 [Gastrolobium bilobum]|uniref:uncharacterized protein LOC133300793 n=1 Tax=Gastrolobium bilobum TaxID=150636 RepID=UPI002AB07828|nr:uncharacterized protein LOC133300793 [Gastrolobium bilobum]
MPRRKRTPERSSYPEYSESSASKKTTAEQFDPIDGLFDTYANNQSGMIESEGIGALCEDLQVDRADVRILILAWKMKAEKQGVFTKDEWRRGLKGLGVDTIAKLRKEIDLLEKEVVAPEFFEDFYSYAFEYNMKEDQQVDIESVCELLNVVLRPAFPTQVNLLIEYLKVQSDYGALNKHHWTSFFPFFKQVRIPNLQNYDDSIEAWPEIIENFVEWFKEKEKNV